MFPGFFIKIMKLLTGGSLINQNTVLTAGKCIQFDMQYWRIYDFLHNF